jgi:hypothetical protein
LIDKITLMYIFEAILLLALDDVESKISNPVDGELRAAIAGCVLAELVLQERITLIDGRVTVINQLPTDHPVLDNSLYNILDTAKPRKLRYWFNTLVYQGVDNEVVNTMVEQGVLERTKKHLRLVKPSKSDPSSNSLIKFNLATRLRCIVLNGKTPDPSETVLLTFLYQTKLHRQVFMAGERKKARKRMRLLVEKEELNDLEATLNKVVKVACDDGN